MTKNPKPSELMARVYGKEADGVYDKLQTLDPQINTMIQEFVYDEVWNYPPLRLKEKSLITGLQHSSPRAARTNCASI